MAGRQRDRFRERDRGRRDNRYNKDYYERRSSFSSDDDERDHHREFNQKDIYNTNPPNQYRNNNNNNNQSRRYSNDRESSWNETYDDRRSNRYRSRSRERSQGDRYDNYDNGSEYGNDRRKEDVAPNNTIMIRNLGLDINENEIMSKLAELGLKPKEIRLMRKKDTGESRGFAFVEFNDINEATYWRDQTQGHIIFSDGQQASLHYSIPKDSFANDRNLQQKTDWTCYKCGVVNFKRRDICFKCSTTREESAANETGDEISTVPTNCLLLRNLNPYTTEERILTILGTLTTLPIKSIKIPKENSVSTCVCFVELYTTHEASQIYALLSTLTSGFIIDDFSISACYAKRNIPNSNGSSNGLKNAASMALAAAQWTNQREGTTHEKNEHFARQPNDQSSLPSNVQIVVPLNAPVLTNGIDYGHVTINNQSYRRYPIPDASNYVLEETSGFYYDAMTCLYYDPNSHYYYNGTTQKYMYWSNDYQTYIPIEQQATTETSNKSEINESSSTIKSESAKKETSDGSTNSATKDEEKLKNDKAKMAKKIAKDMEKWAKSMNQKGRETGNKATSSNLNQEESLSSGSYSSLGLGNTGISLNINTVKEAVKPKLVEKIFLFDDNDHEANSEVVKKELPKAPVSTAKLSPPKDDVVEEKSPDQKLNLTDWNKLICLLCKRQFNSKEQLSKHQQASELHKANLFKLTGVNFTQKQIAELSENDGEFNFSNYRDRAKERRQKYGQSDQPEVPSSRYKEKYMRGIKNAFADDDYANKVQTPADETTLQDSIGAKLLKQMGWSGQGQGLGKTNQGRSSLIEVERRAAGVGLGMKASHPSGESYKDAVKRTMIERYKELHEKEMSNRPS